MTTLALCRLDELAEGTAKRFDVEGHRIAIARVGETYYALGDRCSHEDFSLSLGEVDPETCEIECARHGAAFDLRTGEPMSFPATQAVATYEVIVHGDAVSVVLP